MSRSDLGRIQEEIEKKQIDLTLTNKQSLISAPTRCHTRIQFSPHRSTGRASDRKEQKVVCGLFTKLQHRLFSITRLQRIYTSVMLTTVRTVILTMIGQQSIVQAVFGVMAEGAEQVQ